MKADSFRLIVNALQEANVRYLVAGGLAVNAHGYLRFTKDADLVLELIPENILAAWKALQSLGYQPNVPIRAEQFADPQIRHRLIKEKHMKVLQFYADNHRETPVDIFVTEPFKFSEEYAKAKTKPMGNLLVHYVTLDTLISMKRLAGRPQDIADINQLLLRKPNH